MKKILIITFVSVLLLSVAGTVYLYFTQKPSAPVEEAAPLPETETISYNFSNGETGTLKNPVYQAIRVDEAYGIAVIEESPVYSIEYYSPDQTFNITLTGENLRQARIEAGEALLKKLGIAQEEACKLRVHVGTIMSVSPEFAGRELGLSFCPNRVDLPEDRGMPVEEENTSGITL